MTDFRVTGADQLARAGRALRAQGEAGKGQRKELFKAIQRATRPLKDDVKQAALRDLPRRGGLNRAVASSKITTRTRTGGRNVGVRIVAAGKTVRDLRSLDRGRLRHPVFGNREVWVNQAIRPGWFTRPLEEGAPAVRRELIAAMHTVVRDLTRRSR